MAKKSVVKMSAIEEYFGKFFSKSITRGENHLESGHLISFTYDPKSNQTLAKVLASKRAISYKVEVVFTRMKVLSSSCECTRGLSYCSHVAAVLLHLNRNVSVTDVACAWSVRQKREKSQEPIPSTDFKAFSNIPTPEELRVKLRKIVPTCNGSALSAYWLSNVEEPAEEVTSLDLVNPSDVIFSEEYHQAACKESFLFDHLHVDWDKIQRVAEATKGQSTNPLWTQCRQLRLTASSFGQILCIYNRDSGRQKPSASLLKKLFKPPNLDKIKPTMWGRDHEKTAISQFTKEYGTEVQPTGLWLDECGYLGGSPDGLIGKQGICEVKCPWAYRERDLKETPLTRDSGYFIYVDQGSWCFDNYHEYYHQIQAQLFFTKRSYCTFLVWTPKSLVTKRVDADPLWPLFSLPVLREFYVKELVPYVLNQMSKTN